MRLDPNHPFDLIVRFFDINHGINYLKSLKKKSHRIQSLIQLIMNGNLKCPNCDRITDNISLGICPNDGSKHWDIYSNEHLMTIDHIIPKSKGGKNHIDNYQIMCASCNSKKGNKMPN